MNRFSLLMFPALLIVRVFFTLNSIGDLPARLATHFGANGVADGWMTREDYRVLILLLLVGLPLLLVWLMAGLPGVTNGQGQIPNCEYWFSRERRETTLSFLLRHSCWLGCLTVAVVYGMHVSILRANAVIPPVLATDRFIVMVIVYLCGLVWWVMALIRHFQRVDD